jgi:hypothetical protein
MTESSAFGHAFDAGRMPTGQTNKTWINLGGFNMRKVLLATCLGAMAVFAGGAANANDELNKMSQNPKDWVMPTGDYANTRYS